MLRLNIIVALMSEAIPLIEELDLDEHSRSDVNGLLFRNEDIVLAVSGIGRTRCAAMAEKVRQLPDQADSCAWLNVGIAGHRSRSVGDAFVANSVVDGETGKTWYPSQVLDVGCAADRVITVDSPETEYFANAGYDMEASAFYAAAARHATAELVQCVKVVSDNPDHHIAELTADKVTQLVARQVPAIKAAIVGLKELAVAIERRDPAMGAEKEFYERWRCSFSQRVIIKRLLSKLAAHGKALSIESECLSKCPDAAAVIAEMNRAHRSIWID